jgi:hypothetical protein
MGWIISFVALSLIMAVLTIAGLPQPIKTTAFTLPAVSIGDRVITAFVAFTFVAAFIYGVTLLAAKILL